MSESSQQTVCVSDSLKKKKQEVLLAFQETEDEIDRISKELKEIAEVYRDFGERLANSPATRIYKVGTEAHGHTVEQYDSRSFVTLGNPQAVFNLADDLRRAKKQLIDLDWEKQRLGLR